MKKTILSFLIFSSIILNVSAGIWDSMTDAYNKVKDQFKEAGDSISYIKKCNDRVNPEFFQQENTHLLRVMYVSSVTGTNVRIEPDSKSKSICSLPLNMTVRPVKLMNKATVNNIESYWVKILIPVYLQKEAGAEYGYVFGGYLAHNQNELKSLPENWRKESLKGLLESAVWYNKNDDTKYISFFHDGSFATEDNVTIEWVDDLRCNIKDKKGSWEAVDGKSVKTVFENKEKIQNITVIDAWNIKIDDMEYENVHGGAYFSDQPSYYAVDKYGRNRLQYFSLVNNTNLGLPEKKQSEKMIAAGLDATNTKFLLDYMAYWKKITGEYKNYEEVLKDSYKQKLENDYLKNSTVMNSAFGDFNHDGKNEGIIASNENGNFSFVLISEEEKWKVPLKLKTPLKYDINYVYEYELGFAADLEQPVPYYIVRAKNPISKTNYIWFYTLKNNELVPVCNFSESYENPNKDFFNFRFTKDNLEICYVKPGNLNQIKDIKTYVYEQSVSDEYVFKAQAKIN